MRTWQVVLGSGCRCCTQNQMPVAAGGGMLVRPLRYPLTSDTALHACVQPPKYICPAVTLPFYNSQTHTVMCMHSCRCIQWQTGRQSRGPVNKHLHLCGAKFIHSVAKCSTGEKTSAEGVFHLTTVSTMCKRQRKKCRASKCYCALMIT